MPQADGEDAPEAIEVAVTFIVPDVHAKSLHQGQGLLVVGGDGREEEFLVLGNDGGNWCGVGHREVGLLQLELEKAKLNLPLLL